MFIPLAGVVIMLKNIEAHIFTASGVTIGQRKTTGSLLEVIFTINNCKM